MGNGACPKCGGPRNNGPECLQCGVIYAKAEQQAYQAKRHQLRGGNDQDAKQPQAELLASLRRPSDEFAIDCTACKLEGGMEKKTIPRFPFFIRLIGTFIALPSVFGMLVGFLMMVNRHGGFGLNSMSFLGGLVFFMLSAIGGLVGWMLLMRKKAFVCSRCGFMLERA